MKSDSRRSFIVPVQSGGLTVLFNGPRVFSNSTDQHHLLIVEHSAEAVIEVIVFNETFCIEAPRIYINLELLLASFAQNEVQEKFSEIRKMLMLQKKTVQILQFINSRLCIADYEIKEEFLAILIPKIGDSVHGVIPADIFSMLQKPRLLIPFRTSRPSIQT